MKLRIEAVKALVNALCVSMAYREHDCFMREAANVFAATVHEFADDGVIRALTDQALLNISTFEVQVIQITP